MKRPPQGPGKRRGVSLAGALAALSLVRVAAAQQQLEPQAPAALAAPGEAAAPSLRLSGFMQADWVVHRQASLDEIHASTGASLNEDRFVLRRARVRLDGSYGFALGRLEVDLSVMDGPEVRPFEASLGLGWCESGPVRWVGVGRDDEGLGDERGPDRGARPLALLASAGLLRIPFGFDALEAPTARPLLERTRVVRALFPGQRDLGVGLDVEYRVFRLSLAVMNGAPIGEVSGSGIDFTGAEDVVGRVGVDVPVGTALRLEAGFSGATGLGLHPGTAPTKDTLNWQDGNEDGLVELSELGVIPGAPATASQTFEHFALGADARVRVTLPVLGELALRAELIRAQNMDRGLEPADPVAIGRDLRELGWALGVSQELTRFSLIAVRYEFYDPDADARGVQGAELVPRDPSYSTLSVAAAARLSPLRFIAQYDHEMNALGRGPNGEPTTLANDGLTLRAELVLR